MDARDREIMKVCSSLSKLIARDERPEVETLRHGLNKYSNAMRIKERTAALDESYAKELAKA